VRVACAASLLALGLLAAPPAAAARGDAPFVVTYRCEGDRWLVVGYPAFKDARTAPIRVSWQGRTVELTPIRAGSGARYVNARANLEWWNKGNGGTLSRLLPSVRPLATNCVEA
jgi:membrane-bound inhibitor of C-type lysozyme